MDTSGRLEAGAPSRLKTENSELKTPPTIVFAKAPRPGFVKTRLAQSIGPTAACAAYERLLTEILRNLAPLPRLEIRHTPDDAASEFSRWLRPGWITRPQGGGDLGARLIRAFDETLSLASGPVVVIGADCPDVTIEDLEAATSALDAGSADVVLGPARDGGYWLVALKAAHPSLFQGIDWSTEHVLRQTLDAAARANLQVQLLVEKEDIDTATEWERYLRRSDVRPRNC